MRPTGMIQLPTDNPAARPPRPLHVGLLGIFALMLCLTSSGCSDLSFLITPVRDGGKLKETQVQPGGGDKIAIIEVEGLLINAQTGGLNPLGPQENRLSLFTQQLDRARQDSAVKAVVLRVNSPGGTVTASDTMYDLVKRFRTETKKPVIASCQEVAASGAYYVACATDSIVAQPTSVVGSIGVIFSSFNVERTMNLIGVKPEIVKSGRMKDMASPFKPLEGEERQIVQNMIDSYHRRFVSVVVENRKLAEPQHIGETTDGRVFTGEQGKALGLVDELGTLDDAIRLAKQKANAPSAKVVMYKRPYGYSGSIYATQDAPPPQAGAIYLNLPQTAFSLPRGFYYLWEP